MTASGPSKVVVLDPDARARRQVQLGFAREGIETVVPAIPPDLAKLELGLTNGDAPAIALVGGADAQAIDLVRRARELLVEGNADVPIVVTGHGARGDLIAAGADAVLAHPVYLRDVVTIARILRGVPRDRRGHLVGSLVETTGVYTLVRALCALGRSAVLTLIRGLRRGEIRFYRGEVTSAQVGMIHGQAAFHQLLLWTDARFDFSYEDIVKRAQIPMTARELFADAEHFLEGVRESAELLSPSMVLEQDAQRVQSLGKQIPSEVYGVLRMFDGHRVLADILEDSPYRVFETLRVAQKALEIGLLRPVADHRPKTSWRAVLAIEEWLVGSETRELVVERVQSIESSPVAKQSKPKFKKTKRKRTRTPSGGVEAKPAAAVEAKPNEIDWGALVPRSIGAEVGPLAGVVPAMDAHGEIDVASRDKQREKLEALMDTDKRDRIFPTEIGVEPTVVVRGEDTNEWARVELEAKAEAETKADAAKAKAKAEADAEIAEIKAAAAEQARKADENLAAAAARAAAVASAKVAAEAEAKAHADAAAKANAEAEAQRFRDEAQAKIRESVEKMRIERVLRDEAEAREREQQARRTAAEEAKQYAARVKAAAEAKAVEAKAAEPAAPTTAASTSTAGITATPIGAASANADAADRAAAAMIATPSATPPTARDTASSIAVSDETSPARERSRTTDAKALVHELVTGVVPNADADRRSVRVVVAEAITVSETATATVTVADQMTVVGAADTATVTATPQVTVREQMPRETVRSASGVPVATEDEPSDGTPRAMGNIDTVPMPSDPRRKQPAPEHDGPPVKQTTGEISQSFKPKAEVTQGPSILIDVKPADEAPPVIPADAPDPGQLVADLAAAHAAIAAATAKAIAAPSRGDAASASKDMLVAELRRDAVAFTSEEEAFFNASQSQGHHTHTVPKLESFDDLDEGYVAPKFWDRVFGRAKKKP